MENFIGINRDIVNHWVYQDAEYFKVWFEMIHRARYSKEPSKEMIDGQIVEINYSEFIFGRKKWSERLGVSEQRLRTLLKKLMQDDMIELTMKNNKFSIYRIKNYEMYNHQNNHQETQSDQWNYEHGNRQSNQQPTSTFSEKTLYLSKNVKKSTIRATINKPLILQGKTNSSNQQTNQQITSKQPASNRQLTTKEESKERNNKDIIRPKRSRVYDEDSIPYRSAKYLLKKIREFKPDFKEPDLQKWADHMRKLIELDKRDPKEIGRVIDWVTQDSFWKTNILCTETLRRQWDKVTARMQSGERKVFRSSPAAPHLELVKPTKEEEEILAKAYQQQLLRNQAKRA